MRANPRNRRLPRSLRKYLRNSKAAIRRQLPAEEARRAVAQLTRRLRRTGEHATEVVLTDSKATE